MGQLKYKNHPNHLGYHTMDKHRVCGILLFVNAALSPIRVPGHLHNVLGKVVSEPLLNSIGE